MTPSTDAVLAALHHQVAAEGFAFTGGDTTRSLLATTPLADWDAFADSWNRLEPDTYLAAHGRYRRRRHATFVAVAGAVLTAPHQPHFQSLAYNHLQGDIERWFEPMDSAVAQGATLQRILAFCHGFFGALAPSVARWHVEVHQFRIEANATTAGEPTPEGSHRDGVDYVLVLLVDRSNIARGTTTIHAVGGQPLGDFTLARPLDAAWIDDARVLHGVTAVTPIDPAFDAHRDVLVVTFRRTVATQQ
jgi:hypothetical protein